MRASPLIVAAVTASLATPLAAQQVLEADPDAGRTVIGGPFRAISLSPPTVGISHDEKTVYLLDDEEPEGMMVFSLATGERIRTVSIRRGEGPGELRAITSITPSADGGVYVSSFVRVVEFDSRGRLESSWSVRDVTGRNVCELDGEPAGISEEGRLVRRGAGGVDEVVGDWSLGPLYASRAGENVQEIHERNAPAYYRTVLACTKGRAYVSTLPEGGDPGSFSVLLPEGPAGPSEFPNLELPGEFVDERGRHVGFLTSLDGQGNIVLAADDSDRRIWGAVIDPDTGCHAVLRQPERSDYGVFRGIYADSAVVLHRDREEDLYGDGRRVVTLRGTAARVSLMPLRHVSGDPCPGMFPSMDEEPALDGGATAPARPGRP